MVDANNKFLESKMNEKQIRELTHIKIIIKKI